MKRTTDMLKGTIWKQILLFFFPILFGSFFQQLYNTVDAIVVGNFVGKQALGAVGGSTGTVINLLVGFVVGLTSGATVVIAQSYGSRNARGVKDGVNAGIFIAFAFGAVLTIIGIVFAPWVLTVLKVPEDMYAYSLVYMRIYMIGMIPSLLYNAGAAILRAVGDSRRPLYFLIAACLTNIVLDILFVTVCRWSIAGAAWATVIAQVVSCILTFLVLSGSHEIYSFHLKDFSLDPAVLKKVISIGFPLGIQSCLYSFANLFVQASVNSYGTDMSAAWTAYGKIDALFWNTSNALGTSVLTFAGQNFGAGQIDRMKKGVWESIFMYWIISASLTILCLLTSPYLYRLFTSDRNVIQNGTAILKFLCPYWFTFAFVEVFSQTQRACGDSFVPMVITGIGVAALRIIWILFFPGNTVFDTLICYPVSWITTSLIFLIYYLFGGWLKRAMVRK